MTGPGASHDDMHAVRQAHEATKHDFGRFADGPGHMDWATQPDPFRRFEGATRVPLPHGIEGARDVPWDDVLRRDVPASPLTLGVLGDVLRHALGLSAEKRSGHARWSLRVDPSSGNLHPIEGWVVLPAGDPLPAGPCAWHYAPEDHSVEKRCTLAHDVARGLAASLPAGGFLVALSSVAWREAWKYGVRAFRYCRLDAGHALACLSVAAAVHGWRARLVEEWSSEDVAALLGLDRADGRVAGEPEEPELLAVVAPEMGSDPIFAPEVGALRGSAFEGRANALSPRHVEWPLIDRTERATRAPRREAVREPAGPAPAAATAPLAPARTAGTRALVLRRRSAVDFDGVTGMALPDFLRLMRACMPGARPPLDALAFAPRVHFGLFVHRVEGLDPGLFTLPRTERGAELLASCASDDHGWERVAEAGDLPLHRLAVGDARHLARAVSCHQDIAADGAFSLGMLAELDGALAERGPSAYRELFWECGLVGHVLYLEAEAAGLRATGMGCFFDDPVHAAFGVPDARLQSLYHLAVGAPVDDPRIVTADPYPIERRARA